MPDGVYRRPVVLRGDEEALATACSVDLTASAVHAAASHAGTSRSCDAISEAISEATFVEAAGGNWRE